MGDCDIDCGDGCDLGDCGDCDFGDCDFGDCDCDCGNCDCGDCNCGDCGCIPSCFTCDCVKCDCDNIPGCITCDCVKCDCDNIPGCITCDCGKCDCDCGKCDCDCECGDYCCFNEHFCCFTCSSSGLGDLPTVYPVTAIDDSNYFWCFGRTRRQRPQHNPTRTVITVQPSSGTPQTNEKKETLNDTNSADMSTNAVEVRDPIEHMEMPVSHNADPINKHMEMPVSHNADPIEHMEMPVRDNSDPSQTANDSVPEEEGAVEQEL